MGVVQNGERVKKPPVLCEERLAPQLAVLMDGCNNAVHRVSPGASTTSPVIRSHAENTFSLSAPLFILFSQDLDRFDKLFVQLFF